MRRTGFWLLRTVIAATMVVVAIPSALTLRAAGPKFYADDPLMREPETQDASKAEPADIPLFWDLTSNLFARPGDRATDVRAQNINTIDEVPDSSWFTNRILARPLSVADITRGPLTDPGPVKGRWTITRPKDAGAAPGFTAQDERGTTWFVSFDANGYPEAATGAISVANKLFWALGYYQAENFIVTIRPEEVAIGERALIRVPSGARRQMTADDLHDVFRRSHRGSDGSYRAIASRAIPGKILGGFQYYGTRSDDPNDIVPHEHRRELRALKVFGAWTNLVDMKAGNTLDSVIQEDGRGVVRHYLQDVGSTFGAGANAPREYDEGWEYLYQGDLVWKRLFTLGFYFPTWLSTDYEELPAIGRFEAQDFDPPSWKPRVPTAAFLRARSDDTFWAARRVMAFTDDMIRAAVKTGQYSDPSAEKLLADVLIERRNKIGRAYLVPINPLVDFSLDASGVLMFQNAAVQAGVAEAPDGGYQATWARFDNATGESAPLGQPSTTATTTFPAREGLPSAPGTFVKVQVSAVDAPHDSWEEPVDVYFRRLDAGWKLVGVERLP